MRDDEFERDDAKAKRNARKHRVTFGEAREAFDDPDGIEKPAIPMTSAGNGSAEPPPATWSS